METYEPRNSLLLMPHAPIVSRAALGLSCGPGTGHAFLVASSLADDTVARGGRGGSRGLALFRLENGLNGVSGSRHLVVTWPL